MVHISGELRFPENGGIMQSFLTIPFWRDIILRPIFKIDGTIALAGSRGKKTDAGTGFLP